MTENSWPGGRRHVMHPHEHEAWNREHYPGTLQLCFECKEPTGRCEEDAIWNEDGEPLCESCFQIYEDFPYKKELTNGRFAYIQPLTFGRWRINVTALNNVWNVHDIY